VYFRKQAEQPQCAPHYGVRSYSIAAMKSWLGNYRKNGLDGLKPKPRADLGRPRRLNDEQIAAVAAKCKAFPDYTVRRIYELLLEHDQLGQPPLGYNSLLRIIRKANLLPRGARKDVRKRYEHEAINELWVCDFLHGPPVQTGRRRKKAILCAIIDDHSRVIVGHAFSAHETVSALTVVLKDAFSAYGLPKRFYVDNGPSFSSDLLVSACAKTGISLIHSKPYDSPSRGKIERFFRTVRDRFLPNKATEKSLHELNDDFSTWLRDDYHHRLHSGIGEKPLERYNRSASKVNIRRLASQELDEAFLVRHERIVNNDATISFKGKIYEVPAAYIRQRIELRHPVDEQDELWLYDNGAKIAKLKLVDAKENARIFRPTGDKSKLSFAKRRVHT
jgi:transposase InsO family protein